MKTEHALIFCGGFHNAGNIEFKIKDKELAEKLVKLFSKNTPPDINTLVSFLSDNQVKKLEKHMCGMKDCMCDRSSWICFFR